VNDQTKAGQRDMAGWLEERRTRWTGPRGLTWEEAEPLHRLSWDLAQRRRSAGWSEVEPELRRTWTERYPDKPWDRFLDAAQDLWDDLTAEPGPSPHAGAPGVHDESSRRR
jgi:hypothetical protein